MFTQCAHISNKLCIFDSLEEFPQCGTQNFHLVTVFVSTSWLWHFGVYAGINELLPLKAQKK